MKTSLTLSEDLVAKLHQMAGSKISRSAFIERILRDFVDRRSQARKDVRDIAILNRHSAELNAEMNDALLFQIGSADE